MSQGQKPHLDPTSWEASETYQTLQRLRYRIRDTEEYIPSHQYHRIIDPITVQISQLFRTLRDQHEHITRLEYENGILNGLKRAGLRLYKLEREHKELKERLARNIWREGEGIASEDISELVGENKREVAKARVDVEKAREAFDKWIRREAECRGEN